MYVVAVAQFTAAGTADILVNQYIPRWGCPVTLISGNGMKFTSKISVVLYELFGINKTNTSSYDPCTNGGCLLYTSPSPRDQRGSRMPSSA